MSFKKRLLSLRCLKKDGHCKTYTTKLCLGLCQTSMVEPFVEKIRRENIGRSCWKTIIKQRQLFPWSKIELCNKKNTYNVSLIVAKTILFYVYPKMFKKKCK